MISFKTITAICLGATLCVAQTINISGIVKDTAGVGISGATVKLEVADISTTTGGDGSFTLTKGSTQIRQGINSCGITASPIWIQNQKIVFTLSKKVPVAITIHALSGKQIYNSNRTYGTGTHAIEAPLQSTGIFIYKVNIGGDAYSFKSSSLGIFSAERSASLGNSSALAKQAKTMAVIADVISVVKEGQLNYRCSIRTSDTSGVTIKMIPNAGNVADVDGNVYQSVRIGNQVWTVENLKTTKYNDGTPITHVPDRAAWYNLYSTGSTTGAYCYYENNAANASKWGALYNFYAVDTKKLAPKGWHVPTDAEWTTLENYLIANGYNWDGTTSGNKIAKSMAAQSDWLLCTDTWCQEGCIGVDLSKNNASGFSALPGGCRYDGGFFSNQSDYGYWWSASEDDASFAYYRYLYCIYEYLYRYINNKSLGFSVRLLRD
ncbi:MAG: FISUMP domain-containing protein [Desulfobacterales bacterium]